MHARSLTLGPSCLPDGVRRRGRRRHLRPGAVVVQVALMATVIAGFGALAIDVGMLYTSKSELQAAADSAALAAAANLVGDGALSPDVAAREAAQEFAAKHKVAGEAAYVDQNSDVELGQAVYNGANQKFVFATTAAAHNAVRVTVRRTASSAQGSIPLMFANIYGVSEKDMWARASAVLIPRDIAVVIDLSGSMNDDSELRHYKRFLGEEGDWRDGISVNLRDCWCALNGPEPDRPYIPGTESETQYAGSSGPTIGAMSTWGSPVTVETYDPTTDAGLWYIKKNASCTVSAARTSLQARGYSLDEINCLMSGTNDNSYYNNRVGVILGLGTWRSGRPGGHSGGDGDAYVDSNEVTWAAYPSFRQSWSWSDYITYVSGTSSTMYSTNSNFRYRYGLKTFVNFLLEKQSSVSQTDSLWQTPEEPLRAVKDAVQAMTDVIVALDSLDHMSLEIFATTAHHEVNLSDNLEAVPDRLYRMQSSHYDSTTNMGAGLQMGITELTSSRGRSSAAKVLVMMSDGKPNVGEHGQSTGEGDATTNAWVRSIAQNAADQNIRIYTVSVGQDADQVLMTDIATIGRGQHFHAQGTPDEYTEELQEIFRTLGGKRPVALIE